MRKRNQPHVSEALWTTLVTQTRDVVIILSAFGVLAALGVFVVQHYTAAKDASTILGVLVPAISTIAGTAFGVSQGAKAGAAAGAATAQAAESETEAVRAQSATALAHAAQLRSNLEPVIEAAATPKLTAPPTQLEQTRASLDSIEQSLRAAAGQLST